MKLFTITLIIAAVIAAAALPSVALAANPNFGKADDYGSDRFKAINTFMIEGTTNKEPAGPSGLGLKPCMGRLGFEPCNNCQIFGNRGPKCIKDDEGFFHSWCWKEETSK